MVGIRWWLGLLAWSAIDVMYGRWVGLSWFGQLWFDVDWILNIYITNHISARVMPFHLTISNYV